jgi:hypothetical protein
MNLLTTGIEEGGLGFRDTHCLPADRMMAQDVATAVVSCLEGKCILLEIKQDKHECPIWDWVAQSLK